MATSITEQGITQNPTRYTQASNGDWNISVTSPAALATGSAELAGATVAPIFLKSEVEPEWVPLLSVDGVVIRVGGKNLVSQRTLDSIKASRNPHWDVKGNGSITIGDKGVEIGKTIPVIEFDISKLPEIAAKRDSGNVYAGVKEVKYTHTTDLEGGLPKGLIEQINYTLDPERNRPEDTYSFYQVALLGDYSVTKLKTDTAQADGSLDKEKLKAFITGVNGRLQVIREDYNTIKRMFYLGQEPVGSLLYTETQMASGDGDIQAGRATSVVFSESMVNEFQDTPGEILANKVTEQAALTTKALQTTQQQIANQAAALVAAQAGDQTAQAGLAGALGTAQADVQFLRDVLAKNNIK